MTRTPTPRLLHAAARPLLALAIALGLAACGDEAADPATPREELEANIERADASVRQAPTGTERGLPVRGTVNAQFDGQARQWDITTLNEGTRFSAATYDDAYQLELNIRGESAAGQPDGRFVLELQFDGPQAFKAGATAPSVIASVIPHSGMSPPLWAGKDGMQLTLTRAEWDGHAGRVEGSFSGSLCYRATMMDKPDPGNCKPIEGTFATDLARQVE